MRAPILKQSQLNPHPPLAAQQLGVRGLMGVSQQTKPSYIDTRTHLYTYSSVLSQSVSQLLDR
jgi:hypothetical protein